MARDETIGDGARANAIVASFTEIPWEQAAPKCRTKTIVREHRQLRLVEFQSGFEENGWCEKGHVGYVLEGVLRIEFPEQTVLANIGDTVWIPSGHETRHRAHAVGEFVRLLLFEPSGLAEEIIF